MFNRLSPDELLAGIRERAGQRAREAVRPEGPSMIARPRPVRHVLDAARPSPQVTARMDGYTAVVALRPPPARHQDLETLRRVMAANERVAFDELSHQGTVIERLERDTAALSARLEELEQRTDQALGSVVEGLGRFQKQIAPGGAADLAELKQAAQVQQIQSVVTALQSAAYGEQGAVFSRNNLALAANQLAWTYVGPALQRLGVLSGAQAQWVSTLAPLGSLVTGGLTLGRRQHVRFISGVANFNGNMAVIESLRPRIADADWPQFARRTDIAVNATTTFGTPFPGTAVVRNGVLALVQVGASRAPFRGQVVWLIDTGANGG